MTCVLSISLEITFDRRRSDVGFLHGFVNGVVNGFNLNMKILLSS